MFSRCLICCIELAIIMATALECPNLLIAPISNHCGCTRIATKELLAYICAALGFKCLVIAIGSAIHEFKECAIAIHRKEFVPFATPNHLNNVPAGATKDCFELLNNLSVTAHWTIEALQVAVNNKGEVI